MRRFSVGKRSVQSANRFDFGEGEREERRGEREPRRRAGELRERLRERLREPLRERPGPFLPSAGAPAAPACLWSAAPSFFSAAALVSVFLSSSFLSSGALSALVSILAPASLASSFLIGRRDLGDGDR